MTSTDTSSSMSALALFELWDGHARAGPERLVIRSAGAGLSMNAAALSHRVQTASRALAHEGVAPADLVLLQGLSGIPFAVAALAVWACDAVVIAADAQLAPREVEDLRQAFLPRAVLRPGAGGDLLAEAMPGAVRHPPLPTGAALIKLTSGSTGRPRGIVATADQLLADARNISSGLSLSPDDVCIGAVPLSHSYGMAGVLLQLVLQASPMLIVPGPLPELLAEALSIEEPAVFPGVPYLFEMLARKDGPTVKRRGLRICLSAAAPLRASTAAEFREKIGLPVRSFYGTSETGGITYDASDDGDAALAVEGCVGSALPGVQVRTEGDEGRVVVRGRNVSAGYLGSPGASCDGAFLEGAFLTGDVGRLDERGRLHLTGRIGTLVNVSGRKVNPREIERALTKLAFVSDAAVLGMADGVRGEALVAFVVGAVGLSRETVIAHLKEGLAPYKIPRRVLFLEELPRSLRGKLDHETLRRLASEQAEEAREGQ